MLALHKAPFQLGFNRPCDSYPWSEYSGSRQLHLMFLNGNMININQFSAYQKQAKMHFKTYFDKILLLTMLKEIQHVCLEALLNAVLGF